MTNTDTVLALNRNEYWWRRAPVSFLPLCCSNPWTLSLSSVQGQCEQVTSFPVENALSACPNISSRPRHRPKIYVPPPVSWLPIRVSYGLSGRQGVCQSGRWTVSQGSLQGWVVDAETPVRVFQPPQWGKGEQRNWRREEKRGIHSLGGEWARNHYRERSLFAMEVPANALREVSIMYWAMSVKKKKKKKWMGKKKVFLPVGGSHSESTCQISQKRSWKYTFEWLPSGLHTSRQIISWNNFWEKKKKTANQVS